MTTLRIASRGSALALWQANYIAAKVKELGFDSSIIKIQTTGDKIQDKPLHEIGGKGVFITEVEKALADRRADIAVHSLKDLPVNTPENFSLCSFIKRHAATDVIIFKDETGKKLHLSDKEALSSEDIMLMGAIKIGTGSLRRSCLLKSASRTVEIKPLRGNVDTRLNKLRNDPELDAIILAEASLERLADLIPEGEFTVKRLCPTWFVPSASQGALVVETLKDSEARNQVAPLDCKTTRRLVELERSVLRKLGGDCNMPFGAHFYFEQRPEHEPVLVGRACVLAEDGSKSFAEISFPGEYPISDEDIVAHTLKKLHDDGASAVFAKLNLPEPSWNHLNT